MRKVALICCLVTAGCSLKGIAASTTAGIMKDALPIIQRHKDIKLIGDAIPSNILLMEALLNYQPDNKDLLIALAQSYCFYGFGFVEDTDPERAKMLYLRGYKYAKKALLQNDDFKETLENGWDSIEAFEKALKTLELDDVPSAFWAGTCLGYWLNLSRRDPKALFEIPKVKGFMERVLELDDKYFFGGAHLFMGTYYSMVPSIMGGGAEKAKKEFDTVIEMTEGKFLLAKVIYAQFYLTLIKDEESFEKILNEVLRTPSDVLPDAALANEIAKEKARRLLEKLEELF